MKKSTSIAVVCMSIFTAVMIVSVVSSYDSTYGFTLRSIGFNVYVDQSGLEINARVGAENLGFTPMTMYADNSSYSIASGYNILNLSLTPLTTLSFENSGFPLKNMTVVISVFSELVALFFNLTRTFVLGNLSIGAPFSGFSIDSFTAQSNATALLRVSFDNFFPFIISITKIVVSIGSKVLGNISLQNWDTGFNSLCSYVKMPTSGGPYDLSFSAGPFSWVEENVSLQ